MEYISRFEELTAIKRKGEYELKNDIDCENAKISCILSYFTGKINGAGHTVKNLVISDEIWGDEQTLAMFKNMGRAEIKDIYFENITIEYQKGSYKPRIGALAGSCSDCIINNVIMSVFNSSDSEIPLIYEASNCEIQNNKITCNQEFRHNSIGSVPQIN